METSIVISLVSLCGAVAAPVVAWMLGRRREQSADVRLNYDELQEDFAALRTEFRAYRQEAENRDRQARVREDMLEGKVRHLENEVAGLRNGISNGAIPPLPPRPSWVSAGPP